MKKLLALLLLLPMLAFGQVVTRPGVTGVFNPANNGGPLAGSTVTATTKFSGPTLELTGVGAAPADGVYRVGAGANYWYTANTLGWLWQNNVNTSALNLEVNAGTFGFSISGPSTADTILARDAAGNLALRNGTTPQTFRVYTTYTDASNYSRLSLQTDGSNVYLLTDFAGTGTDRPFYIGTRGTSPVILRTSNADRFSLTGTVLAAVGSTFAGASQTVTYSASMTVDASIGNTATITATNGTAFTINAPSNPTTGQQLLVRIRNTSGGALGVATWNAVFKMTAWTQPATTFSRAIQFNYDGTNWVEFTRTAADVPN